MIKKSGSASENPPITHILDEYINDESGKIGNEDIERVELSDMKMLPHKHIGAIICRGPVNTLQTGTGMLISKNMVLTCAHVIFNKHYNAPYPKIYFYLGQYG